MIKTKGGKQLEQQHLDALDGDGDEISAKACASVTLEHIKGFAEWIGSHHWNYNALDEWWENENQTLTTEELIELYFQYLNK